MISITTLFESWLCYAALSGLVILAVGSTTVWICKEPIYKVRIIQWTFLACLIVPLVQVFGLTPGIEMGLLSARPEPVKAELFQQEQKVESSPSPAPNPSFDSRMSNLSDQIDPAVSRAMAPALAASTFPVESESLEKAQGVAMNFSAWLTWSWCIVVAMLGIWWVVGLFVRRLIALQSSPANENVRNVLESIAGEKAASVRLLINRRIKSPVMWGCFRPTIVIPASHVEEPQSLRWGLAHEWSHIQRRDFLTRLLAMGTQLVCFFQPFFWWLNRELALSQDLLADAFAATQGHADEYAAFLVDLSKQNRLQLVPVGLGIAEGRSTVFRRIKTLLVSSRPPLQKVGRIAAVLIAVLSITAITCLGAVRLVTAPSDTQDMVADQQQVEGKDDKNAKPINAKPIKAKAESKPEVHFGVVVDADTNLPVSGAKVHVKRELSRDPETGKWILLEQTEHETNFLGVYSFSLTAEQVAQSSLYLEIKTEHPDYQTQGWGGYSYRMIQKNMKKGDFPWFTKINLQPGEVVSGTIVDPDGSPLPNVQISTYTKKTGKGTKRRSRGTFFRTKTNEEGRFGFIAPNPGDGVMWIFPEGYSPQAHRLAGGETAAIERKRIDAMQAARAVKEKLGSEHPNFRAAMADIERIESQLAEVVKESGIRRDFGTIKMQPGVKLSGKVLDAEGNPLSGVAVNLRRKGDGEAADQFLNRNAVANGISGGTMTGPDGTFQMKPLPPGTYRVRIEEKVDDPTAERKGNWFDKRGKAKLKHVFAPGNIEITSEPQEPMVFQAVPHVTIRGQYFRSNGKTRVGHSSSFWGKFDDGWYSTQSPRTDKEGRFEIRVPKGITEARMNPITNEHSSLRWKLPGSKDYSRADTIPLGTLDKDLDGLRIVRYEAPIIVVKVADSEGKAVKGYSISARYTKQQDEKYGISYNTGHVGFEKQSDGRWRSSQLLPDEEISIEITRGLKRDPLGNIKQKPVALAEAKTLTLKEGETRSLNFVVDSLAK